MKELISKERTLYLNKKKRRKFWISLTQFSILIGFIILWEWLANVGIIDSFITSQPSRIWNTILNYQENQLFYHIGITCLETIVGFLLGTLIGTVIASFLWWSDFWSKVFDPYLVILNSLPKVALGPIIIVWVGAGTPAIITMALAISLVVTILEMVNGFHHTDKNLVKMSSTFQASKRQVFFKIIFPANITTLINTLKVNIGLSLVGVISGEFLVSKGGLGYLIVYGGQVFKLDLVMTSVIILGIVAAILYQLIVLFEKFILNVVMHRH